MDDARAEAVAPIALSRSVSQETRDRLEAAKEAYKAEKDRYRKEKDVHRQMRERRVSEETRPVAEPSTNAPAPPAVHKVRDGGVSTSAAAGPSSRTANAPPANGESVTQIISNARGPYPQLEMINVTPPRRHHTVQGIGRSRRVPSGETAGPSRSFSTSHHTPTGATRAGNAIKTKLADMGFTSEAYPDLSKRVASRVSLAITDDGNNITQEAEDTIMSEVLDELLTANVDKDLPPKPASTTTTSVPGEWLN